MPTQRKSHVDMEESTTAYVSGGLFPIDIGSKISNRYRVIDKLAFERSFRPWSTSWLTRDEESGSIVQLDIFDSQTSTEVANARPSGLFRAFVGSPSVSNAKPFQNVFDEFWWASNPNTGFTAEEFRNLTSTLVLGISQLHEQGLLHGDISTRNLILTSTECHELSDQTLLELLEAPVTVPTKEIFNSKDPELANRLPERMVLTLDPVALMGLGYIARGKAFPPMLKSGEKPVKRPAYRAPESLYDTDGDYCASNEVWAVACVFFELVTGTNPFSEYGPPELLVSQMHDLLGEMPVPLQNQWRIPSNALDRSQCPGTPRKRLPEELRTRIAAFGLSSVDADQLDPVFNEKEYGLLVDLMAQMLRYDPVERPSIKEVLNHPWFST